MNEEMKEMLKKAQDLYGDITFCGKAKCWEECFTIIRDNRLMFWFNVGKDTKALQS